MTAVRILEYYPSEIEVVRLLRGVSPQLILLDVEVLGDAAGVARSIEAHAPGVPVIAAGRSPDSGALLEMMRAGVREFLLAPFEERAAAEALARVRQAAERAPQVGELSEEVYAFLPSKPGAGTSTVALHLSAALARTPDTRVLLADFDLNSGMIGFMLKLARPFSVTEAAENAFGMDDNLWSQLVSSSGALDVLPAGKISPGFRIEPPQIRSVLDYARRHYRVVCLDLSGNLEKYSVEIMHESKRVFLVCTPELPSLHLAREKLGYLRAIDLSDRVQVVLNRAGKRDVVTAAEVEKLLGQPICYSFPNDYKGLHAALASGTPVEWNSELGRRFLAAAETILAGPGAAKTGKRKFVEYFSLVPARYNFFPGTK